MKLGIALSGGGIKGMAHVGVLRALEENGIHVDVIGGTSSGSLIASLYALGYTPYYIYELSKRYTKEMLDFEVKPIVKSAKDFVKTKKFLVQGFVKGELMEQAYNELALKKGVKNLKDLKMPLAIPAVDIKTGKKIVFTNYKNEDTAQIKYILDAKLGTAVRASSSFPGVFYPCEYENYKLVDGGILDNVPVKEVKKLGVDKVIAVNFKKEEIKDESNFMDISMHTINIMGKQVLKENLEASDYIIDIEANKIGLLDVEKIDYCFKLGYEETIKNIDKIKSIISQ